MNIILAIIILGALIFVHELGHFLVAKAFNIGVLEFSIGFGRRLLSKQLGETTYSIRLIPLGGFVRLVGDDPEALQNQEYFYESYKDLLESGSPLVKKAILNKNRWFYNKPIYQRSLVVLAGPIFNLLFAYFIGIYLFTNQGVSYPTSLPIIGEVFQDHPAYTAGIKKGDIIISMAEKKIFNWNDIYNVMTTNKGERLKIELLRKNKEGEYVKKVIYVKPKIDDSPIAVLLDNNNKDRYKIGIATDYVYVGIPFSTALLASAAQIYNILEISLHGVYHMIVGDISVEHIGGPIMMVQQVNEKAKESISAVLMLAIVINVSLAFLNLLPIPVLDGGHLLLFFLEAIKREPLSLKTIRIANNIGIIFILFLTAIAFTNDIFRIFIKNLE